MYDKALIIQGFVVSEVWESALLLGVVTKLFGNRYKTFRFCPLFRRPADRFTSPYVSPHFRCYADLKTEDSRFHIQTCSFPS
jgi:hypothetical protein